MGQRSVTSIIESGSEPNNRAYPLTTTGRSTKVMSSGPLEGTGWVEFGGAGGAGRASAQVDEGFALHHHCTTAPLQLVVHHHDEPTSLSLLS
jgi:hypothetical protein